MAGNLTAQVRNIADVTTAVATGDLSKKITVDVKGEILELKNTINVMVDQLNSFASEVTRVAREVGTEGKLGGQAIVKGISGTWKDLTDNVNLMANNLTGQVRNIAAVTTAVATGDLSKKITVDVKGEILELKNTINVMVDQLNSFASEVTRVAREVGTDGKLGGQAVVKGVAGVWKDLTDNVNSMASNLTDQVRGIAKVVTAVANGDLKRKLTVETKGEIAALADTINGMIETLATFAEQVTTVAREVGVEGQLGGQASVPGAAGTWKDLTDNVNQLAANLTTQMRAIAEVATAVTTGDLTRSIAISARGEVAALKDNINEMIRHLRDTTQKNSDQDWLKTNLAKFSRMLQGQKDLLTVGRLILSELAPVVSAQHGVFYILDSSGEEPVLRLLASYAYAERKTVANRFKLGEGLVGQCALETDKILLSPVPPDYIQISSGLGGSAPLNVIVLPVVFENQVKAVLELASLERFNATHQAFLDQLAETIGIVLNTIEANSRTEDLLAQSQSLAKELQNQQEELRQTNQQLEEKAGLLAQQNVEVERKNQEIEQARQAIEEKAAQLALTSKYKSEFLANMSHELRTPLNSLLILSDQLSKNPEGNLSERQREFARTIHSSGNDLLLLINDILDLSKIESGTVSLDVSEVRFSELQRQTENAFRPIADTKGVAFRLEFGPDLPRFIQTDQKRLRQVLKNLLSNAFKFTARGSVTLSVSLERAGWNRENEGLNQASAVIAFSVTDTGIGIHQSKHQIIFEAFQQADGSTSRRYGGTGLGLAISREIATLLGGDIRVESAPGQGSTFTLYLPASFSMPKQAKKAPFSGAVSRSRNLPRLLSRVDDDVLPPIQGIADDRESVDPGERVLLIVDNDPSFAQLLVGVARDEGWKAIVAVSGASAVAQAREYQPSAITLDIRLPDIDGLRVLRVLKADLGTRHIPVQVISTEEEEGLAQRLGAWAYLRKPIAQQEVLVDTIHALREYAERTNRDLLLVAGEDATGELLAHLTEELDVRVTATSSLPDAFSLAEEMQFDCMVVDPSISPRPCSEIAEELAQRAQSRSPQGRNIRVLMRPGDSSRDNRDFRENGALLVVKTMAALVDATAQVLHQRVESLAPATRRRTQSLESDEESLAGRRILIVDDDVRNIFALTSVLEKQGMDVASAETGQAALELLRTDAVVDAVLMDIMMPGMDGFDTIRAIRSLPERQSVPIIAVTAKAMKGDREKTLEAGAWDYLSKPVDTEQMLRVLRAWLKP
jgi:signal transduction histidine kinase/CheY-like chemotaxis protein/HAMP domain-containing protein